MKIVLIILGLFVTLAVIGGVMIISYGPAELLKSLTPQPARTEVRSATVTTERLIETVSAPGEIEPLTKVEISAEVASRIEQLPFRAGDEIHRDDVIVRLDDRTLSASLKSAKAQREAERFRLQSEQARRVGIMQHLEFARRNLQRQATLYDSGDVSRSNLDDAQDRVADLEAQVESITHSLSVIESSLAVADANIDSAEDALTKTVIRSPIDGIVTQLNAEVGEVVLMGTMNNPGTVIMTIADLTRMILNARVAETDVAKIAAAQNARIHINAYRDRVYNGVVRTIALQRTTELAGTGYFETEIELDLQGQRIYSGLVANVDIEIARHEGLVVESQAIVERLVEDLPPEIRRSPLVDRRKRVTNVLYRIVDGKAMCTPVKPGPSDLTHTLVLQGIDEGDEIIVGPYKVLESLKHEQLVKHEDDTPAGDEPDDEPDRVTSR
ncbi:MAG: efflux RND transporter periplasmic adaptor subunit [Planctomycetes bacterium]|nr:efflux RND transporter periplasmic adaptor subunit [Planctomycetota bacterium]